MEQVNFNGFEVVEVDCLWSRLPKAYFQLKPVVYSDGETFYCLLGPNPQEGVFGYGSNSDEAIFEWHAHLKELLRDSQNNRINLLEHFFY